MCPNLSCFAEVDFATKYISGMPYLFQGLENADTREIEQYIIGKHIFVVAVKNIDEKVSRRVGHNGTPMTKS